MANVSSSNGLEKYPKLRFKGFSEPWIKTPFSKLYRYVSEKNDGSMGVDKIISVANMYFKPDARISDEEYLRTYNVFRLGDIAFEGNKSKNFAFGRFVENTIGDGIVSHVFVVFRPLQPDHNLGYWKYAINNENVMGRILARCTKKTTMMTNLVSDDFLEEEMFCPSNAEQMRISSFLELLERKINTQTSLVEYLKKYKRGVIKEFLTPQTCPIKNAVWNEATIGELGTFVKGAPLSKADISDEGTPFILYGELYTTYGEVINEVVRKTQKSVDNVYMSRIGDVLIPTSGETPEEISTASCVMVSGVILAGDLNIFRTSKVDGRIMSYVLNHIVNSNIARIAQGKSVVHIQASEISKISISYPDENTQQQLISIFDGISERITLVEKSLAKLILLKKSLIQKIFI